MAISYEPKSDSFESFLNDLNSAVSLGMGDFPPPAMPHQTAQIVGLPRSGTTIIYQLLALTGRVGYPSNVMALFWENPTIGARIQKHLATSQPTLGMRSVAGRTVEPLDPHEFGYFWRNALGHSRNSVVADQEPTPWDQLQSTLDAVTGVFDSPTVYKNFLALAHIDAFRANLERQKYLVVLRPQYDVALSLIAVRRSIGISDSADFGLAVEGIAPDAPLVHRVATQVRSLQELLLSARFDQDSDALLIDYPAICRNPKVGIGEVLEFIGADRHTGWDAKLPDSLPLGKTPAGVTPAEAEQLATLLSEGRS